MQIEIRNRWSGKAQFTAEIEADENTNWRIKIGLAVKWAIKGDADLSDAVLSGADLSGADLSGADLSGADLSGADLSDAVLSDADLSDADLSGADLRDAILRDAVLRGADLRDADLRGADLRGYKINRVIARVTRNDGYEFLGFDTDRGLLIRAGCRTFLISEYRAHVVNEYPATPKAEETTAILDFIEARWKVLAPTTASQVAA